MDAPPIQYARTDDGVSIAYSVQPGRSGTPALLVPAIPAISSVETTVSEFDLFRGLADLVSQDRSVVRYDRRGTGGSQRGDLDYSLAALTLDLVAVTNALNLPPVALYSVNAEMR